MPATLLNPTLSAVHKGFPHHSRPLPLQEIGQQGWNVLRGDLPFPIAVIRQEALENNLRWMQNYARGQGVHLAPHGKTTLSPQLFRRQLDAGAWGMTVANVTQLQTALAAGATNCLIANQVFAANDLAQIDRLKRSHTGLRIVFLVDSLAQLDLIEQAQPSAGAMAPGAPSASSAPLAPFEVLLEIGAAGGRTGCRTQAEALQLARRINASPAARLVGIECYEGLGATGQHAADQAYASDLMQRVTAIAQACDCDGLFEAKEVLVSAGGSGIFDLVAPHLKPALSRPVRGVLRSGCYVTHDQGSYQRLVGAVNTRLGCGDGLHAALEVWAAVQSRPEPGLAILTVGKRDISHDQSLPTVLRHCPRGAATVLTAPADWQVTALNDQHAYLRSEPASFAGLASLAVGDLLCLGLSHPCTTFDKWRWMPLVDERYNVVDAIVTCF